MRRLFVAVFAALLVVIGLSVVSVGTATAATPLRTENSACSGLRTALSDAEALVVGSGADQVTSAVKAARIADARNALRANSCDGYNGNGGGNGGSLNSCSDYARVGIFDISRGDPRYRDFLDRDGDGVACERNEGSVRGGGYGLPRYNSCSDYNRNGIRDIRRGDVRYNQSWDRNNNGIACDTGDVVVSSDGNCVTFTDTNRNYGNLYNQNYPTWNNLNTRNLRRENLSTADRRNLERLARDLNNYRNQWNTTSNQLRTICNDPTPPVTIINQAAPIVVAPAPAAPAYAAPAPATSGSIPSGSVNTGGFSAAYMLAHNRAI